MTDHATQDDETQFGEALTRLIARAHAEGIDVEGGWKCTVDGNGHFHWNVEITRVEYEPE